ncbi:hypothetical protein G4B88_030764 [Cannabis sativa]|uniref:RNase H type-1 domain-containing protein n=1 Tax=Cannabis sativa TaxID=3483 RepID=A0A7J6H8J4_CANSA|nr:hypothetical protein G4B88_030764 [Cannabis sativa]
MLTMPDSLVARKAKYFHHNSFLSTFKGHCASFTRQSLLWGRDLLKRGLLWKVGNDKSISTLHSYWIPSWRFIFIKDRLLEFFDRDLVSSILAVPIADPTLKDSLIWESKIGIVATVRNFRGEVVAALSSPLNGNLSPLLAEAKALVSTLNWCTAVKFPLSVVESDYKVLIGKVKHKWKGKSALLDLVSQIVSILSNFPTIIVHHVSRQFNVASHKLAIERSYLE